MANAPATTNQQQTQLAPKDVQISQSERFTNMVMKQYSSTGVYNPTEREKQLIRNYFICIDQMRRRPKRSVSARTRQPQPRLRQHSAV